MRKVDQIRNKAAALRARRSAGRKASRAKVAREQVTADIRRRIGNVLLKRTGYAGVL